MMELQGKVLDCPMRWGTRHIRRYVETDAHALLNTVTKHVRRVVYLSLEGLCHHLEQQTDTITTWIADKRTA